MGIEELKNKLQKSLKGTHVEILSNSSIAQHDKSYPTPSYDLNRIISGSFFGGLPSKSLTLLVAPEASFKSSFMCLMAVEAQKDGYIPVIIDSEGAWTDQFVSHWGLDADNIIYVYTPWVDKVTTLLGDLSAGDDEKLFIILDSVGGLERAKLLDDTQKTDRRAKADQGTLQKEIKRMLKMLLYVIKAKNSIGMMAGHFFGNPNSFGGAEDVNGGKFLKLAPDIIVSLRKNVIYKNPDAAYKDRVVIGSEIKALCQKNRFYPPFQEATIEINYQDGINKFAGLCDMALECGVIEKTGSWFKLPDDTKVQGMKRVTEWFGEHPDMILDELEKALKITGYSTVNDNLKQAEKLGEVSDES